MENIHELIGKPIGIIFYGVPTIAFIQSITYNERSTGKYIENISVKIKDTNKFAHEFDVQERQICWDVENHEYWKNVLAE